MMLTYLASKQYTEPYEIAETEQQPLAQYVHPLHDSATDRGVPTSHLMLVTDLLY